VTSMAPVTSFWVLLGLSFAIVSVSMLGLGMGVWLGRGPLRGRCGADACEVCPRPCARRPDGRPRAR